MAWLDRAGLGDWLGLGLWHHGLARARPSGAGMAVSMRFHLRTLIVALAPAGLNFAALGLALRASVRSQRRHDRLTVLPCGPPDVERTAIQRREHRQRRNIVQVDVATRVSSTAQNAILRRVRVVQHRGCAVNPVPRSGRSSSPDRSGCSTERFRRSRSHVRRSVTELLQEASRADAMADTGEVYL